MLAAIEARRGLLSIQEFTTKALNAALEHPDELAKLRRELAELRQRVDQLAPRSVELLTF